jgi:hypothetical protein
VVSPVSSIFNFYSLRPVGGSADITPVPARTPFIGYIAASSTGSAKTSDKIFNYCYVAHDVCFGSVGGVGCC